VRNISINLPDIVDTTYTKAVDKDIASDDVMKVVEMDMSTINNGKHSNIFCPLISPLSIYTRLMTC
jgi:hypothetical protein